MPIGINLKDESEDNDTGPLSHWNEDSEEEPSCEPECSEATDIQLYEVPEWEYRNYLRQNEGKIRKPENYWSSDTVEAWVNEDGDFVAKYTDSHYGAGKQFWTPNPNFQAINIFRKLSR